MMNVQNNKQKSRILNNKNFRVFFFIFIIICYPLGILYLIGRFNTYLMARFPSTYKSNVIKNKHISVYGYTPGTLGWHSRFQNNAISRF